MKNFKILCFLPLILIFIACFDCTELENRNFSVSLGIDKSRGTEHSFLLSAALPNLKAIVEGGDELKEVKDAESDTLLSALQKADDESNKTMYYGQTKILVFGKELLEDRELFLEALDSLERNKNIPKNILVLATEGEANEVLKAKPSGSPMLGFYISNYYKNSPNASIESLRLDLRTLINSIRETGTVLIPLIEIKDTSVTLSGCAVINDSHLTGLLSGTETKGITWINGGAADNNIDIQYENGFIPLHVTKQKSRLSFSEKDGRLVCDIFITTEGSILEYTLSDSNSLDSERQKQLQEDFEAKIAADILLSLEKLQKELQTDGCGLYTRLFKQNYSLFKKLSENWNEVYLSMEFTPHISVKIKGTGMAQTNHSR